jgi:hypothetical protein
MTTARQFAHKIGSFFAGIWSRAAKPREEREICVSEDWDGLRIAALELIEEVLDQPERMRSANPEEMLAQRRSKYKLSSGYYTWLIYIMEEIETPLDRGVDPRELHLNNDERAALLILSEARLEFWRLHPPCSRCKRPVANSRDARCSECLRAAAAFTAGGVH